MFQVRRQQLQCIGEIFRQLAPISWGSAQDVQLQHMTRPHLWALQNIPWPGLKTTMSTSITISKALIRLYLVLTCGADLPNGSGSSATWPLWASSAPLTAGTASTASRSGTSAGGRMASGPWVPSAAWIEGPWPPFASGFALTPVSGGHPVALERTWKRAWHGSSLHRIERIALEGLSIGKKGRLSLLLKATSFRPRIYLSPSFQYTFCLRPGCF